MLLRARTSSILSSWNLPKRLTTEITPQLIKQNTQEFEDEEREKKDRLDRARPFSEIPGPRQFPIIKSWWIFFPFIGLMDRTSKGAFYNRMYQKYGKLVRVSIPGRELVFCFDPPSIARMFDSEYKFPARPGMEALAHYRRSTPEVYPTVGVFFSQGEDWFKLRRTVTKYFHRPEITQHYIPPLEEVAKDFVSRMKIVRNRHDEVKDFSQELFKWAVESVGYLGLNRRLGCLHYNLSPYSECQGIVNSLNDTFSALDKMESFYPFYKYFQTLSYRRLMYAQEHLHSILTTYINDAMTAEKSDATDNPRQGQLSLLDNLIGDRRLDVKTIAVLINEVFFGGVKTTANATLFTLYNLARNQKKQQLLRESVLKAKEQLPYDKFAVSHNQYMSDCIDESQRLNPITVGIARVLQQDLEMAEYRVPAGTVVAAISTQIGRMEEFFDRPQDFVPERFTTSYQRAGIKRPIREGSHIPFGSGVRECLGKSIAYYEMSILISELLLNFNIECSNPSVYSKFGVVNVPSGAVHLTLRDLKESS